MSLKDMELNKEIQHIKKLIEEMDIQLEDMGGPHITEDDRIRDILVGAFDWDRVLYIDCNRIAELLDVDIGMIKEIVNEFGVNNANRC